MKYCLKSDSKINVRNFLNCITFKPESRRSVNIKIFVSGTMHVTGACRFDDRSYAIALFSLSVAAYQRSINPDDSRVIQLSAYADMTNCGLSVGYVVDRDRLAIIANRFGFLVDLDGCNYMALKLKYPVDQRKMTTTLYSIDSRSDVSNICIEELTKSLESQSVTAKLHECIFTKRRSPFRKKCFVSFNVFNSGKIVVSTTCSRAWLGCYLNIRDMFSSCRREIEVRRDNKDTLLLSTIEDMNFI